jgi:hypothetical protein
MFLRLMNGLFQAALRVFPSEKLGSSGGKLRQFFRWRLGQALLYSLTLRMAAYKPKGN